MELDRNRAVPIRSLVFDPFSLESMDYPRRGNAPTRTAPRGNDDEARVDGHQKVWGRRALASVVSVLEHVGSHLLRLTERVSRASMARLLALM